MSSDSDEHWIAFTPYGEPLDRPLTKVEAASGVLHGSTHVWVWRQGDSGPELLMQQRSHSMKTWPGWWDCSAAGHMNFGETPVDAVFREAKEEIGISLDTASLELLFVARCLLRSPGTDILENEFQWVYGHMALEGTQLSFGDGEVSTTRWVPLDALGELMAGKSAGERVVPHSDAYLASLTEGIRRVSGL